MAVCFTDLANFQALEDESHLKSPNRREIDAPKPVVHKIKTEDGFNLRLTRYEAGTKGPVIMAPGFTVNAISFAADTVKENTR
ncbi:MAG: hypothetical protein U5K54_09285 [Cytophagales bacterium]|nr:hypothetical protein [Cytophagales bacterium]